MEIVHIHLKPDNLTCLILFNVKKNVYFVYDTHLLFMNTNFFPVFFICYGGFYFHKQFDWTIETFGKLPWLYQ